MGSRQDSSGRDSNSRSGGSQTLMAFWRGPERMGLARAFRGHEGPAVFAQIAPNLSDRQIAQPPPDGLREPTGRGNRRTKDRARTVRNGDGSAVYPEKVRGERGERVLPDLGQRDGMDRSVGRRLMRAGTLPLRQAPMGAARPVAEPTIETPHTGKTLPGELPARPEPNPLAIVSRPSGEAGIVDQSTATDCNDGCRAAFARARRQRHSKPRCSQHLGRDTYELTGKLRGG